MVLTGLGYWVGQEGLSGKRLWRLWGSLWEAKAVGAVFSLNGDITVRTFALVLSFALFTHFSSGMGVEILAANTLLLQVLTLTAYFVDGFAFATESLAGFYHGRKQREAGEAAAQQQLWGGAGVSEWAEFAVGFGHCSGIHGVFGELVWPNHQPRGGFGAD